MTVAYNIQLIKTPHLVLIGILTPKCVLPMATPEKTPPGGRMGPTRSLDDREQRARGLECREGQVHRWGLGAGEGKL